jgi:hypothetical protein
MKLRHYANKKEEGDLLNNSVVTVLKIRNRRGHSIKALLRNVLTKMMCPRLQLLQTSLRKN